MRGQVKLGRAPGPDVGPANLAVAINTCASHCQSFAVALQVNLVNSHPTTFAPDNVAVAANGGCNGCTAVAVALKYNIGVDDPDDVPPRVNQLIVAMRQELVQIDNSDMPLNKRIDGLNAVIGQFQDLAGDLIASRDVEVSPEKAPAPPAAPTQTTAPASTSPATPAPSPSPNPQPSPAATPSTSPEPSPSPT